MPRFQKQQVFANSCGAASLLCASLEIGVDQLPALQGHVLWDGRALATTHHCESAIYEVSSGDQQGGLILINAGYSFPHNLVTAARLLGLRGSVYMEPGAVSAMLQLFYKKCVTLAQGAGVAVTHQACPPLGLYERELRVVVVRANLSRFLPYVPSGLHYVLVRPDGSVMDPALGRDFPSFAALNQTLAPNANYMETGISVVVEPDDGMNPLQLLFAQ